METSGLIERRRVDGNRRSLFIYLTEKGKAAAARTQEIFAAAEETALEGISQQEKKILCDLLERVYENLTRKEVQE